jgi:hypothetical protein
MNNEQSGEIKILKNEIEKFNDEMKLIIKNKDITIQNISNKNDEQLNLIKSSDYFINRLKDNHFISLKEIKSD